jgi:hypothetical protein
MGNWSAVLQDVMHALNQWSTYDRQLPDSKDA